MHLLPASTSDVHTPSANTAAVVTYTAVSGKAHGITGLAWSYNDDPTSGNLKVEDGASNTVFSVDITNKGPGVIYFEPSKVGTDGSAMIVTLSAGGASVTGKVSVLGHFQK